MAVRYRLMRAAEASAVVAIWHYNPNHDLLLIDRRWRHDPRYLEHIHVGAADTGEVLAAVSYVLRTVRDRRGAPQRIGHLFYIATRPDAQQQGHGRELLMRTTRAMQQDGCQRAMIRRRSVHEH